MKNNVFLDLNRENLKTYESRKKVKHDT
jgi:hypothetical protein